MDIVIVCHTEFGLVDHRKIAFAKHATHGVTQGVSVLRDLAARHGAKITFAVCPEVVPFMPDRRGHEIGLHIHPGWEVFKNKYHEWHVGDSYLREHCAQSTNSSGLARFPYREQLDMIRVGREYVKRELGEDPKVFVAGRWSFNNDTGKALCELGFTHDCSAVPGLRRDDYDWAKLPRIMPPYHPAPHDYQERGSLALLCIPASMALGGVIVSPESASRAGLAWLKACFLEYYKQGVPIFHIQLHSPAMTDSYYTHALDSLLSFMGGMPNIHFRFVSEISEYPEQTFHTELVSYLRGVNPIILKTGIQHLM